eukprot:jgi/Botrbrau1/5595/Bobra.97_2s0021.1
MNATIVNSIEQHLARLVKHYEAETTAGDANPSLKSTWGRRRSSRGTAYTQQVRSNSDQASLSGWSCKYSIGTNPSNNRTIEAIRDCCERLFSVGGTSLRNAAQMFASKGVEFVKVLIEALRTVTPDHPDLLQDLVLIIHALLQHPDGQKSCIPLCISMYEALLGCIGRRRPGENINCRTIKLISAFFTDMMRIIPNEAHEELVPYSEAYLHWLEKSGMLPGTGTGPYLRTQEESKSQGKEVQRPPGPDSMENRLTNLQVSYVDVSTSKDPEILDYCLDVFKYCKKLTDESKRVPKVMDGGDKVRWALWVNVVYCLTKCLKVKECELNVKSALLLAKIGALCNAKPSSHHGEDLHEHLAVNVNRAALWKRDTQRLQEALVHAGTYTTLWKMVADANSSSPSAELQAATVALFFLTHADPEQEILLRESIARKNPFVDTQTIEKAIDSLLTQIVDLYPNCQGSVIQLMSPVLAMKLMRCNEVLFQHMQEQKSSPNLNQEGLDVSGLDGRNVQDHVNERWQVNTVNSELACNACEILFSSDNIICKESAEALSSTIKQTCPGESPTDMDTAVNRHYKISPDEVEMLAIQTLRAISDELSAQDKKAHESLRLASPPLLTSNLGWDSTLETHFRACVKNQLEEKVLSINKHKRQNHA